MPKLLLDYKGVPTILSHKFEKVDRMTYITVHTTGKNDYTRVDFKDVESAIDFSPEACTLKVTFVYIESKKDGVNRALYQSINFANNKLILSSNISLVNKGFLFTVKYDDNLLLAEKKSVSSSTPEYTINYYRPNYYSDSFYEIIPDYEDVFLEIVFVLDIMTRNYTVRTKEELEAYFLQAKLKIKKNKDTKKDNQLVEFESRNLNEQIELVDLIGLHKVKLEIQELKALAEFRKKRLNLGLPVTPTTLHMVFTGNPGTGKTTVARLLAKIYCDIGLLPENKLVEVSRTELVGQSVGHTAPKTQKVFESALGGILFIDEAYSLFKTGNDFGSEAVQTLLKLMEDNRERIVVIIAGYPKEIEELLLSNPGVKSRFSKHLKFDDYSKDELVQIFNRMTMDYHNILTEGAKYKLEYLIDKNYDLGHFSSNARIIRNIFEETIKRQSNRLSTVENPRQEEITTFIDKDLPDELN